MLSSSLSSRVVIFIIPCRHLHHPVLSSSSSSSRVVIVIITCCRVQINASTAAFKEHVDRETSHPNRRGPKIVRVYKLYSRCSNKHVQILGRSINAFGGRDSEHGECPSSLHVLLPLAAFKSLFYLWKSLLTLQYCTCSFRRSPPHLSMFTCFREVWFASSSGTVTSAGCDGSYGYMWRCHLYSVQPALLRVFPLNIQLNWCYKHE